MDLEKWLSDNTFKDKTLEELFVSNEAFNPVTFIKNRYGKSNKGEGYRVLRTENTYNHQATITVINRTFGDSAWLRRQNWNTTPLSGGGIYEFLNVTDYEGIIKVIEQADSELSTHYTTVKDKVQNYLNQTLPVADMLKDGLVDAILPKTNSMAKRVRPLLKIVPLTSNAFIHNRPLNITDTIPKDPEYVGDIKLPPLNREQVATLARTMIESAIKLKQKSTDIENHLNSICELPNVLNLLILSRKRPARTPEGSKYDAVKWSQIALVLDPHKAYSRHTALMNARYYYGQILIAVSRWIDRSIK